MDGRERLAQPLTWIARRRASGHEPPARPRRLAPRRAPGVVGRLGSRLARLVQRAAAPILRIPLPRGAGSMATALVVFSSLGYGVIKGDHVAPVVEALKDARDQVGNAIGFRIVALALTGSQQVSREEILATAGVTGRSSLLFLDVEATREKLKTHPWI